MEEIIKDIPANLIPAELWKAFTLILLSVLILVVKKYLTEMKESNKEMKDSNKEFRATLLKLVVNDAVQDKQLEAHEGRLEKVEDKNHATIRYRK